MTLRDMAEQEKRSSDPAWRPIAACGAALGLLVSSALLYVVTTGLTG